MKTFGEKLKEARLSAGMTQSVLAQRIGIKQQQLSQRECDKVEPTLSNIVALLKVLQVNPDDLIEDPDAY